MKPREYRYHRFKQKLKWVKNPISSEIHIGGKNFDAYEFGNMIMVATKSNWITLSCKDNEVMVLKDGTIIQK